VRRAKVLAVMIAVALFAGPGVAPATGAFSPDELIGLERHMDGRRVTIQGEAIGEELRAGQDYRWVNLLGESVAVGVYMHEMDAGLIDSFGSYRRTGDIVRVTGILNIACDEHGGDLDVHAQIVEVVEEGQPISRELEAWKLLLVGAALAVFAAQTLVYRWLRARSM